MTPTTDTGRGAAGPQKASQGRTGAFRQEYVVTARGFGRIVIDRVRADSQEEAERIVLKRNGVEVHSALLGE